MRRSSTRWNSSGSRPARATVPAARCLGGLHLHLRADPSTGRRRAWQVAERCTSTASADRPRRYVLGHGELLPGGRWRQLRRLRPEGTGRQEDTGKTDLQGMVDYMAAFASTTPLPVDYSQRAVTVPCRATPGRWYAPGSPPSGSNVRSLDMRLRLVTEGHYVEVFVEGGRGESFPVDPTAGGDGSNE